MSLVVVEGILFTSNCTSFVSELLSNECILTDVCVMQLIRRTAFILALGQCRTINFETVDSFYVLIIFKDKIANPIG